MKKNTVYLNSIGALSLQVISIICGLVLPRAIIGKYGSHVYGLTASLTQFLSYIMLLEGGLSSVTMAALYKPILDKDEKKINGIINATKMFFGKISIIYTIYVVFLGWGYSFIVDTEKKSSYVFFLTAVLASQLYLQYFFSLSYKLLLNAYKKVFLVSIIQIITVILNAIFTYIGVVCFNDIIFVKIVGVLPFALQPILFYYYSKKYFHLDSEIEPDKQSIKQRWDGFGQNLAYFVHTNTDIVILSLFTSLETVSVYSLYFFVANGLKMFIMSMSSAVTPSMGNVLVSEDKKTIINSFDKYFYVLCALSIVLFSCGIILIVPFISLYTKGFDDAQYYQPLFGVIILLAELIYCIRDPFISVIYSSGHFRQTAKYSYIEAVLNIVISIICVNKFGLVGVAVGTFVSMFYRMVVVIVYACDVILKVRKEKYVKAIAHNFLFIVFIIVIFYLLLSVNISSVLYWIIYSFVVVVIIGAVYYIYSLITLKRTFGDLYIILRYR